MTPLPKRRHSSARSGKRVRALARTHLKLAKCPHCGQPQKPHRVCPSCGQYGKRLVIPPKKEKKTK